MGFLEDLIGYRIRLVQIAAYKDFESVTKGFGQAPRYFGLLSLVEANPGLPQGKLAEASISFDRASFRSSINWRWTELSSADRRKEIVA